jgi:hypothetical protein
MLAGMYDASLDAFVPHSWNFNLFNYFNGSRPWTSNQCFGTGTCTQFYYPVITGYPLSHEYDQLNWFGFSFGYSGGIFYQKSLGGVRGEMVMEAEMAMPLSIAKDRAGNDMDKKEKTISAKQAESDEISPSPKPQETQGIQIRKDFNETAFFFPQLATNENGEIVIKFKAPEALTRWKMMGLAYTKDLKYGQVEKTLVTQKDLMLFTNVPRFLREGDNMEFAAKISNISERDLKGVAELHFFDAFTMKPVDDVLGLASATILFTVNKGLSSPVSWKINIPEGL